MGDTKWLGLSEKTFKDIYLKYYEDLCQFAWSYTSDRDVAEDLVQEVLIYLWQNRESLKINTSLKSYLYRAVYNKFIDEHRKSKKQSKMLENIRFETTVETIESFKEEINIEKLAEAKRVIDDLPPKCRNIFLMSKIQNLTYGEIAEELNISIKTVEAQMSIAFKKIRSHLSGTITSVIFYYLLNF